MRKAFMIVMAIALSGCAAIPQTDALHYGNELTPPVTGQFIRVIARPPIAGMNGEELVRGFLDACADNANNYAVARQYLAQGTDWDPNVGISIYDSAGLSITGEGSSISLVAPADSAVSASGHFLVASSGSEVTANFRLTTDGAGEWRISQLASGLLLGRDALDRSFRAYPAYFVSPDGSTLVPDSVMVPIGFGGTATALVKALLAGPSRLLAPAVRNAFPVGVRLTYNSVPIAMGVATVDLTDEVLAADSVTRQELAAQLIWTLSALPEVSSVRLLSNGQPVQVRGVPKTFAQRDVKKPTPAGPGEAGDVFIEDAGQVYQQNRDGGRTPFASIAPEVTTAFFGGNASRDNKRVALVAADGQSLWASSGSLISEVAKGEAISRPTWTAGGDLLWADYGVGLKSISADGVAADVLVEASTLGTAAQVRQISLAPDGIRVALVFSSGTVDTLGVGYLTQGTNVKRIIGVHPVNRTVTSVRDLQWGNGSTLLVLGGSTAGGETLISVSTLNGSQSVTAVPVGAQSVAWEVSKETMLSVAAGQGRKIMRQSGFTWQDDGSGYLAFYRG